MTHTPTPSPAPSSTHSGYPAHAPPPTSFPKDKIRVVLAEGIHPRAAEVLSAEGFAVEQFAKALTDHEAQALLAGPASSSASPAAGPAHILGIRSKTRLSAGELSASRRLIGVGCFCIGTDQVDLSAAAHAGVAVFNSPFSNTRSVAELTICEIIALCRGLTDKNAAMHAGSWDKSAAGAHEVRGRTLGIVGYGHIGSQVSVLAEALGLRVLFFDTARKLPLGNARPARSLDELLAASDIVTLHVPDTPSTRGMIGREQLAKMRADSMLINNARGSVVDLKPLADALKSGKISGAALDVFPSEPAAKNEPFTSELRNIRNVILTPHIGGSTEEAQEAIAEEVALKLVRLVNDGSTVGSVNLPEVDLPSQGDQMDRSLSREESGSDPGRITRRLHRVLHLHRNVPGVLSNVHAAIADLGVNISGEYLQTRGELGYVVMDIEPTHRSSEILERLADLAETVRARVLW